MCFGGSEYGQGQCDRFSGDLHRLGPGGDGDAVLRRPHLWRPLQPHHCHRLRHLSSLSLETGRRHFSWFSISIWIVLFGWILLEFRCLLNLFANSNKKSFKTWESDVNTQESKICKYGTFLLHEVLSINFFLFDYNTNICSIYDSDLKLLLCFISSLDSQVKCHFLVIR